MSDIDYSPQGGAAPVSARRVLRRAFVLAAISCRGAIESSAGQPEAEALCPRILDWISFLGIDDELEPQERRIVYSQLGQLDKSDVIEATWSVEGLAILAWALNWFTLPKHDELVDPYKTTDAVCFLSKGASELATQAKMRAPDELIAYREIVYATHCRLREFARNKQRKNFTAWIDKSWVELLKIDANHLIIHDDLGINGREISDSEPAQIQSCESATFRRHKAICWLLGGYPVYSQTPIAT